MIACFGLAAAIFLICAFLDVLSCVPNPNKEEFASK